MKFSDVIGNESVVASLRHLADSGQIPHALLFNGPAGAGKMAAARAFAQYVHCKHPHDGEPCGTCSACRMHQQLQHPDLHFVYPIIKKDSKKLRVSEDYIDEWREYIAAHPWMPYEEWVDAMEEGSNSQPMIFVAESTEILRTASLSPSVADHKIFIVWLPEKFNAETANKLLKIIEEPFEDTLFLMVSDAPQLVLPTIYSRTQSIHFTRLTDEETARYMEMRGKPAEEARQLARIAQGSLIKADELLAEATETDEFRQVFQEFMRRAYTRDIKELKKISETVAAYKREKTRRFFNYCGNMVRENFIYNLNNPALNAMTAEDEAFSKKFAPFINARNVEGLMKAIDEASGDIARNGNARIVCFDFLLQVMTLIR